ncbi:hypothetical protein BKA70DRAFT_1241886 [Coprinopsis sp. MPI-PUGE-AT-0042]|nr:hypothetical protein BKA70DRAFT_1241886 [Coprinopsis sp. MPI-PUGE-AT-0042]
MEMSVVVDITASRGQIPSVDLNVMPMDSCSHPCRGMTYLGLKQLTLGSPSPVDQVSESSYPGSREAPMAVARGSASEASLAMSTHRRLLKILRLRSRMASAKRSGKRKALRCTINAEAKSRDLRLYAVELKIDAIPAQKVYKGIHIQRTWRKGQDIVHHQYTLNTPTTTLTSRAAGDGEVGRLRTCASAARTSILPLVVPLDTAECVGGMRTQQLSTWLEWLAMKGGGGPKQITHEFCHGRLTSPPSSEQASKRHEQWHSGKIPVAEARARPSGAEQWSWIEITPRLPICPQPSRPRRISQERSVKSKQLTHHVCGRRSNQLSLPSATPRSPVSNPHWHSCHHRAETVDEKFIPMAYGLRSGFIRKIRDSSSLVLHGCPVIRHESLRQSLVTLQEKRGLRICCTIDAQRSAQSSIRSPSGSSTTTLVAETSSLLLNRNESLRLLSLHHHSCTTFDGDRDTNTGDLAPHPASPQSELSHGHPDGQCLRNSGRYWDRSCLGLSLVLSTSELGVQAVVGVGKGRRLDNCIVDEPVNRPASSECILSLHMFYTVGNPRLGDGRMIVTIYVRDGAEADSY